MKKMLICEQLFKQMKIAGITINYITIPQISSSSTYFIHLWTEMPVSFHNNGQMQTIQQYSFTVSDKLKFNYDDTFNPKPFPRNILYSVVSKVFAAIPSKEFMLRWFGDESALDKIAHIAKVNHIHALNIDTGKQLNNTFKRFHFKRLGV